MDIITKIATRIMNANKTQRLLVFIVLLAVFIPIFVLNRLYPLLGEDWDYSYVWNPTNDLPYRVSGFMDIVRSQYSHYFNWGGRSITHAIAQTLLMMPAFWHDLINSLIYVAFVFLVYRFINHVNKTNFLLLIVVALSLWLFLPEFMCAVIWVTYSANYLWGILIILLFIMPYYDYYISERQWQSALLPPVMFVGGIIAGWTNENMSLAVVVFTLGLLVLIKYQKMTIPKWAVVGLIGFIIGCIVLIIAPGNYMRGIASDQNKGDFFDNIVLRLTIMRKLYWSYILFLSCTFVITLSAFYYKYKNTDKKKIVSLSLLLFAVAHIAIFVMVGSPEFPRRALFGVVTCIIIATGMLYAKLNVQYPAISFVSCVLIVAMAFIAYPDYKKKYDFTSYLNSFWHQREVYVKEQKEKGNLDIIFDKKMTFNNDFIVYEIESDSTAWANKVYARFYGVHSVRLITSNNLK